MTDTAITTLQIDDAWASRAAARLPQRVGAAPRVVVVGLGKTGLSVVRYLQRLGAQIAITDSRVQPTEAAALAALAVTAVTRFGGFDASLLADADLVVVSPGIASQGAFFDTARARGLPVIGDIELFAQALAVGGDASVVGITGTNGKSTVTSLLGEMAHAAGWRARAGGNLGPPALELLDVNADLYVLELSSYQLETTESLKLAAASVLNVTADHLDRYADMDAYARAKARIFRHSDVAVVNLDDTWVASMPAATRRVTFSLRADSGADYTLREADGKAWLARGEELLLSLDEMRLAGTHNAANALAAWALGESLGMPRAAMLQTLRNFAGLPHRAQWVRERHGVRYINDSKGTNVGATLAAVAGLAGPLLVIAGGDGKGQDFSPLRSAFRDKVRAALLIGRDAPQLRAALAGVCECHDCASLPEAVELAAGLARPGDTVLLSPACASLDMFRDYAQRGEIFTRAVQELAA